MQRCVFPIRRCRLLLSLFEGAIRSVKAECTWLRMQRLQARLDAVMGNSDRPKGNRISPTEPQALCTMFSRLTHPIEGQSFVQPNLTKVQLLPWILSAPCDAAPAFARERSHSTSLEATTDNVTIECDSPRMILP
jgi:hypothetical protein